MPVTGNGVQGTELAPWSLLEVLLCRYILPGKHISIWVEIAKDFGIKYTNFVLNSLFFWTLEYLYFSSDFSSKVILFLGGVFFFFSLMTNCSEHKVYISIFWIDSWIDSVFYKADLKDPCLLQQSWFFLSLHSDILCEMETVFEFLFLCHLSTSFMNTGWELQLWLLRHISLHFLFFLVSFISSGIFLYSSERYASSSKQALLCNLLTVDFGEFGGDGNSFTTWTKNKHAWLLPFWPICSPASCFLYCKS